MRMRTSRIAIGMALVLIVICAFALAAIVFRNYDGDAGVCPDRSSVSLQSEVEAYLKENKKDARALLFGGKEHYDIASNWWIVPFSVNSIEYEAMVDCRGGIELTGPLH